MWFAGPFSLSPLSLPFPLSFSCPGLATPPTPPAQDPQRVSCLQHKFEPFSLNFLRDSKTLDSPGGATVLIRRQRMGTLQIMTMTPPRPTITPSPATQRAGLHGCSCRKDQRLWSQRSVSWHGFPCEHWWWTWEGAWGRSRWWWHQHRGVASWPGVLQSSTSWRCVEGENHFPDTVIRQDAFCFVFPGTTLRNWAVTSEQF